MPTSLPPLPKDIKHGPPDSKGASKGSAFTGGLPKLMQLVQQIESGYQELAQLLPGFVPMAAEAISNLRQAIPSALSAGAAAQGPPQQGPPPGIPGAPAIQGGQAAPSPMMQG